jgi:putative ABC transport system substrate-binding protein
MNRRETIIALVALDAMALPVRGQRATGVPRIGYLSSNLTGSPSMTEGFHQGLRDLGYVEGRNIAIEIRDANGKLERLPALAAELVTLKVDVIVVGGTSGALAAQHATRAVPIVFVSAVDPVADGLVSSLPRPGGNVTGLSALSSELVGKRLEELKRAVPGMRQVAVLWQPGAVPERTEHDILKAAEVAARTLGVRLQVVKAHVPGDFDAAFSEMINAHADAMMVLGGTMFLIERTHLVDLAARNRLPAMYGLREYVDEGGLMCYGPDNADMSRRAAIYVDKILKGTKPADLPVEQPTKFDLVINLKAAKALGLTIPPSLLQRAELIQ